MTAPCEQTIQFDPLPVVFVVDDDAAVRATLEALIVACGWKAELYESARAFLARPPVSGPSCLLLELRLPDLTGLDVQRIIAQDEPHMPIIFITGHGDVPVSVQAMKAGAFEFLTKPLTGEIVVGAIRQALGRSEILLFAQLEALVVRARYRTLSVREREVMRLVISGMTNKRIGAELGISVITVKAHRGHLMRKMQAASVPDLVKMDAKLG